jgi:uncharacterized membrane protein
VNFEQNKQLGGIGAILMFIGIFPYINLYGVTELVGAVLILIAMKGFADYYREASIFNNALYAIIAGIVGVMAFVAIGVLAFVDFFTNLGINLSVNTINEWVAQVSQINPNDIAIDTAFRLVGFIFLDLIVLFVFMVITAVLLRKSLTLLKEKTGVHLFGSAGIVLLVGAVLVIAFGFGLILVWISVLLLAIAFFEMRPMQPQAPPVQIIPPTTPMQA